MSQEDVSRHGGTEKLKTPTYLIKRYSSSIQIPLMIGLFVK